MIFDTHAHYDDESFDADREELLERLPAEGIGAVVNIGSSVATTAASLALSIRYPWIYATVGVHPSEVDELSEDAMSWMGDMCRRKKVVAVGEIGLDYHYEDSKRNCQKYWFERQLLLAKKVKLPVVIHTRDAAADTLDMMKSEAARGTDGIIHCFPFGAGMAKEYLNLGYYLGIGGVLTFKNGKKMREAAAYAPLDRIVLETDSPYLTPEPFRGQRNDSSQLRLVIRELAQIKGVSEETIEQVTWENAGKVYRIN